MYSLTICHLYPDILNLYGDRGNVIALQKRCLWRGIDVGIQNISLGRPFSAEQCDILFIGGGQDFEQEIMLEDFYKQHEEIKRYVENDGTVLAICGGYQMLGKYYETEEKLIELPGVINIETKSSKKRLIGNLVFEWVHNQTGESYRAVGFENHSGLTYLGEGVNPLGKVVKGFGNNGEDGYEGARYKNVFCSYSHGSLLPKNPHLADYILSCAFKKKYPDAPELQELNDREELEANRSMIKRLLK